MRKKIAAGAAVGAVSEADIVRGLNPEQLQVVRHVLGPLLVAAVAGAGKTKALVARIARLVLVEGIEGSLILALTFSTKAAKEMNERLAKLLPELLARVGTFHSLAFQFLREEWRDFDSWEVDDRDRYRMCVKDALGWRGMKWDSADLTTVGQFIGLCKAQCAIAGSDAARNLAVEFRAKLPCNQRNVALLCEAYSRAEQLRVERRLITFDDMLLEMWRAMSEDEATRARWASRWEFVMQDESQDENPVQRAICELLARDHRNYMIVGDPAQSIYGFRGSDPSGMLAFEGKWAAHVIRMNRNYRSGDEIIRVANRVLDAMPAETHLGMQIKAERGEPGRVTVHRAPDADGEADAVCTTIREMHTDGAKYSGMAVLYRTNAQSRALEEKLLGARVPYVVIGGLSFYERKEVKDLLAYLRIAAGRGKYDDVRRCINAPFRFLGKEFTGRIEDVADQRGSLRDGKGADFWIEVVRGVTGRLQERQRVSVIEWCGLIEEMARAIDEQRERIAEYRATMSDADVAQALNMGDVPLDAPGDSDPDAVHGEKRWEARPERLLENLLQETGYIKWITRDEGTESPENNRVSNVRELVRAAGRFGTVDELLDYIEETTRAARSQADEQGPADRVTLMSIHRSKGLEWPTVFVIGVSEKILPHGKAHDDTEERRLFYVACTRARDTLAISSIAAAAYGANVVDLAPSRFLAEAGLVSDPTTNAIDPADPLLIPASGGEHEIPNAPEV